MKNGAKFVIWERIEAGKDLKCSASRAGCSELDRDILQGNACWKGTCGNPKKDYFLKCEKCTVKNIKSV